MAVRVLSRDAPESGAEPPAATVAELARSPLADLDDATLVAAHRGGDRRAAAALWDRYSVMVRRRIARCLGPDVDAEDHVQEVFARLFDGLSRLADAGALRSFLYGIALHVARDALRRRKARSWLIFSREPELSYDAPAATDTPARHALRRLYLHLNRLKPDLRLAFVLRYVEELDLKELSEAMGWSLATTKRRLARARKQLFIAAQNDPVLCDYLASNDREEP